MKWVRPFLAVMGMAGLTAGFWAGRIDAQTYVAIVAVTVTWWFSARDKDKKTPPAAKG